YFWSMMEAQQLLELEVRELIRSRGLDPTGEPETVRELVATATSDYDARSMHAALPMLDDVVSTQQAVFDAVAGFGPLQPLLDDPEVEEIWINSPAQVFCARNGITELTNISLSSQLVAEIVGKMLIISAPRLDDSPACVGAALPVDSVLPVVLHGITAMNGAVYRRNFVVFAYKLAD